MVAVALAPDFCVVLRHGMRAGLILGHGEGFKTEDAARQIANDGTACACHLPDALGISQPTLSHHLKKLAEAGLVTREQRGRWAHYTVVRNVLDVARDFLGESTEGPRCC